MSGVSTPAVLGKYDVEGVRGEERESGEWSDEKCVGDVKFIGEKLESEDPLGVGGDLSVG